MELINTGLQMKHPPSICCWDGKNSGKSEQAVFRSAFQSSVSEETSVFLTRLSITVVLVRRWQVSGVRVCSIGGMKMTRQVRRNGRKEMSQCYLDHQNMGRNLRVLLRPLVARLLTKHT